MNTHANRLYAVCVYGGSYEDHYESVIFVTDDIKLANSYRKDFNARLKKWKSYFKGMMVKAFNAPIFDMNKNNVHFSRFYKVMNTGGVIVRTVEFRSVKPKKNETGRRVNR